MENYTMKDEETKTTEKVEGRTQGVDIPDFMKKQINTNQTQEVEPEKPKPNKTELKYIKNCDGKNWPVLKEIDELIGIIISNDYEPDRIKLRYEVQVKTNYRKQRSRGCIDTKRNR